MKILYCNVSCDFRPIRCKNHLMQFIFFVFYYSSGKTWNTFIHVSFFAAVCTALYHRVAFFCQSTDVSVQLEALDILGDLLSRFGGTWSNYCGMFKLCYTASPKPKWWCKGQRVVRSALKTVHSGQFDKHPPPQKKKYIYIYILQHPPALSQ